MQLDKMCLKVVYITIAYTRIGLIEIIFVIIIDKRREKARAFTLQVSISKSN